MFLMGIAIVFFPRIIFFIAKQTKTELFCGPNVLRKTSSESNGAHGSWGHTFQVGRVVFSLNTPPRKTLSASPHPTGRELGSQGTIST